MTKQTYQTYAIDHTFRFTNIVASNPFGKLFKR